MANNTAQGTLTVKPSTGKDINIKAERNLEIPVQAAETTSLLGDVATASSKLAVDLTDIKGKSLRDQTLQQVEGLALAAGVAEDTLREGGRVQDVTPAQAQAALIAGSQRFGEGDSVEDILADATIQEAMVQYQELRQAANDGALTSNEVRSRARAITTRMVAQNPGYKTQIRQAASSRLGFDPTSTDMSATLAYLDQVERGKTDKLSAQEEKIMLLREKLGSAIGPGILAPRPQAIRHLARLDQLSLNQSLATSKVTNNQFAGEEFSNVVNQSISVAVEDSVALVASMRSSGDLVTVGDEEEAVRSIFGALNQQLRSQSRTASQLMIDTGDTFGFGATTGTANSAALRTSLEDAKVAEEQALKLVESGNLTKWYEQAASHNAQAAEFYVSNFTDLMRMQAAVGEDAVGDFLTVSFAYLDNPRSLEAYLKANPEARGQFAMANFFGHTSEIFQNVLQGVPIVSQNPEDYTLAAAYNQQIQVSTTATDDVKAIQYNLSADQSDVDALRSVNSRQAVRSVVTNPKQAKAFATSYARQLPDTALEVASLYTAIKPFEDPSNPIKIVSEGGQLVIKGSTVAPGSVATGEPMADLTSQTADPVRDAQMNLATLKVRMNDVNLLRQLKALYKGKGVIDGGPQTEIDKEINRILGQFANATPSSSDE